MRRQGRMLVTSVVAVAMFAPVALDRDSFPLSTYPMYARVRANEVSLATAQGIDDEERPHALSLPTIGASDDPLIVAGELRAAISDGRSDERCREIAARVAGDGFVAIEVVIERHDVVDQASGRPSLLTRTVHARCPVEAPA